MSREFLINCKQRGFRSRTLDHGQRQNAREVYAHEGELAKRLGLTENQAAAIQLPAWIDLLFGEMSDKNKSVMQANEALALANTPTLPSSRLKLRPSRAMRPKRAV